MKRHVPFVAVGLILVGVLLLLDRTRVVDFGWWAVFWGAVGLYGAYRIVGGFRSPNKGGIVWGTVLLSVGLYQVLGDIGLVSIPGGMLFPAFLAVVGTGVMLLVVRRPSDWHLAVPALLLLGVGSAMILAEMDLLDRWEILGLFHTWWPAALILFGAALLLNRSTAKN
jgi:hypothetical protein